MIFCWLDLQIQQVDLTKLPMFQERTESLGKFTWDGLGWHVFYVEDVSLLQTKSQTVNEVLVD